MSNASAATAINPYAPPQGPVEIDFREAAVEESLRLLEAGGGRSADELGVSLVLPAAAGGPARLRSISWMIVARFVLTGAGLLGGAVLMMVGDKFPNLLGIPPWQLLILGGVCSLGSMWLLLSSYHYLRRCVRRALEDRYESLRRQSTPRPPLCTGVEDARTFTRLKFAPEDFAYIAFDSSRHRLIVEGLVFRYVIQSADVLAVEQVNGPTSTGAQIIFRVGRVVIGVTLQYLGLWNDLKCGMGIRRDPLVGVIQETFAAPRAAR